MSTSTTPSSQDGRLAEIFGGSLTELHKRVTRPDAPPALTRALELPAFLALTEVQVARVRDRVHEAMAPSRDMGELSAGDLRFDVQWLAAALDARDGYRAALGELLRTMPAQSEERSLRPVEFAQPQITTTLPPTAAPAPPRAGAPPGPRP